MRISIHSSVSPINRLRCHVGRRVVSVLDLSVGQERCCSQILTENIFIVLFPNPVHSGVLNRRDALAGDVHPV